jgi:hypothetical protein
MKRNRSAGSAVYWGGNSSDDYTAEGTTVMRKRIAGLGIAVAAMGAPNHTAAGLGELTRTRIGTIAQCTRQGTMVVPRARA